MNPVCDQTRMELYRKLRNLERALSSCPKYGQKEVVMLNTARIQMEIARVKHDLGIDKA